MTGGRAFVYNDIESDRFYEKINPELVEALRIDQDEWDADAFELKTLLKDYHEKTGSETAKFILDNWRIQIRKFWMVAPRGVKPTMIADMKGE